MPEEDGIVSGSYRPWEEGNIAPQVVFEVLSPKHSPGEMVRKRE
jgi:Uma2 family endonuclease